MKWILTIIPETAADMQSAHRLARDADEYISGNYLDDPTAEIETLEFEGKRWNDLHTIATKFGNCVIR